MLKITVKDFSCIKKAELTLSELTVLIGPQASGKSVLSKLVFFFISETLGQYDKIIDNKSFDDFTEYLKSRFADWFPVPAWGDKVFKIDFQMSDYRIRFTRTSYETSVRDNLRISTSAVVKEHYRESQESLKALRARIATKKKASSEFDFREFELSWELRETSRRVLAKRLGKDFVALQTFIPAGRSFFTTLGRAVVAFDQGKQLDPVTVQFGRMFAAMQDARMRFIYHTDEPSSEVARELAEMLGGKIIWRDDQALFECSDGRSMPLSALSSGQQELLPLVNVISSMNNEIQPGGLVYIEEPEAHLFPSSQSKLIQVLACITRGTRLLLTTHSPYVLAKINNLIKAGQLEKSLPSNKKAKLQAIVPSKYRLQPGAVSAYAICDGELVNLIDEDGLIGADYLDSISSDISMEFSKMLELEYT
ncbi:ATP-binding protein [uncultured Xanthomonas sp.]|uniref:AAA family ATPase n=1 Tax=uncultured Xanthomonas sp. TaxID=152831 RepID=UPI0025DE70D0|nr:ATP-binding protein [uncultured Xanthomonas sp.]